MNKFTKYTSLIFVGTLLLTPMVYAEEVNVSNELRVQQKAEFKDLRTTEAKGVKNLRGEFNNNISQEKNTLKEGLVQKRAEIKNATDEQKNTLKIELQKKREEMLNTLQVKREEFKKELDTKKEEAKTKITAAREKLKTDLLKIKDDKKKETVQNIVDKIAELNTRAVNNLTELTSKIEGILAKVESRANEEKAKGVDTTATDEAIAKAKVSIADAKAAILAQSTKVYTTDITTDSALKGSMSKIREALNTDIKTLKDKIKLAHTAVKNAIITLPMPPKPEVNADSNTKVETSTTTTTN